MKPEEFPGQTAVVGSRDMFFLGSGWLTKQNTFWIALNRFELPSGNLTYSYWKWPFIVDFPIKNGDFPLLF